MTTASKLPLRDLALGSGFAMIFAGAAHASGSCNVASMQAAAPKDTTVTAATMADSPVPHCKVEGYVTTTDPHPNHVNFALRLPPKSKWNGRFYFANQGGSGGSIPA